MPELFINGQPVRAEKNQTVMQAAVANGFVIPYFCWHPQLSVAGNCRICVVEVEDEKGGNWTDIACNMPVSEGMRVLTDSEGVAAHRKAMLQLTLLNHPVDCGICDKAGECTLQDYHYQYNGSPSVSRDAKVRTTKFYPLSDRIVLDNERCILCSRCVRFTSEISKSHALGIEQRGDHSLVRAVEDGRFDVGPLLRQRRRHLPGRRPALAVVPPQGPRLVPEVDAFGLPGLRAGLHRQALASQAGVEALQALDPRQNASIARVTPLENPAVNGPWICNKGRDLARIFERPRAEQAMLNGVPVDLPRGDRRGTPADRRGEAPRRAGVELGLQRGARGIQGGSGRTLRVVRQAGPQLPRRASRSRISLLIRPDKNPNTAGARKLFGDAAPAFREGTDLVLVWGEGFDFDRLPTGAKIIFLNAYLQPENARADVFLPLSIQTERSGHYTNFQGVVSAFEPCFPKQASVADAETALRRARGARGGPGVIQDLVVYVIFIGYALGLLLTFGTVLTWVERKQAAIMSDRIGANRAYVRIPFTQIKLVWLGLFHGSPTG